MPEYEEFRLELTPTNRAPTGWDVTLAKCPVAALVGDKGTVTPTFTRAQLLRLRNRNNWPSLTELESIGQGVWNSVMTPLASAAFDAALQFVKVQNKGMRITMVMLGGEEVNLLPGIEIRLSELPVEALCRQQQFIGTDLDTPISRTRQFDPTHEPYQVVLPLRVLVVVASPSDKPPAKTDEEAQAIRTALANLATPGGPIELEFCEPPNRDELRNRLKRPCHILHFIGHGGFAQLDNDVVQTPYVSFVRTDSDLSDNVSAADLAGLLQNTSVRLLILTACSSAAPAPAEEPYRIGAFEGLAQRVLDGNSQISATVAMQFDMESDAAVNFTRVFYENLLRPDRILDETVTLARKELATSAQFGAGHRAWVTPTVFWRCKGGRVFNIDAFSAKPSEAIQRELQILEAQISTFRRILDDMANQPQSIRDGLDEMRTRYQAEVEDRLSQRAQLFGESIRLRGDVVKPGAEYQARLSLRVRSPGTIDLIKLTISYQADKLKYEGRDAGSDTPGNSATVDNTNPGELEVVILNPSNGQNWSPREYEVALLKFSLAAGLQPGIIDLQVKVLEIRRGGQLLTSVQPLDAVLFVDDPDPV